MPRCIGTIPRTWWSRKNYIQLLILTDRLDDARKLNDEIIKARPDDEDAQIYKGEIEIRSGKASDAVNTLQGVLKNDPDNAVAHYQQGLAFDQLGNTNRAEAEWRDAVRLRPDIVEAHRALAGVAIHRGDPVDWRRKRTRSSPCSPAPTDICCAGWPKSIASISRPRMSTSSVPRKGAQQSGRLCAVGQPADGAEPVCRSAKAFQQALDQDPNSTDALGGVLNADLMQKQPDRAIARPNAVGEISQERRVSHHAGSNC
jgi:tetratricopeptide (TPR) repeat protein